MSALSGIAGPDGVGGGQGQRGAGSGQGPITHEFPTRYLFVCHAKFLLGNGFLRRTVGTAGGGQPVMDPILASGPPVLSSGLMRFHPQTAPSGGTGVCRRRREWSRSPISVPFQQRSPQHEIRLVIPPSRVVPPASSQCPQASTLKPQASSGSAGPGGLRAEPGRRPIQPDKGENQDGNRHLCRRMFWGVEATFRQVKGVKSTAVGYCGGHFDSPTYKDVCTDKTGHAEAVEVQYDPAEVNYDQLLDIFWKNHDPRRGTVKGPTSARSTAPVVFSHTPQQKAAAEAAKAKLQAGGRFPRTDRHRDRSCRNLLEGRGVSSAVPGETRPVEVPTCKRLFKSCHSPEAMRGHEDIMSSRTPLTQLPVWQELQSHYQTVKDDHLRDLFRKDPARGQRMTLEAVGLYLDYSKNRVTGETLALLLQLARGRGLRGRIDAMFRGEKINITENRAVLHVALRAPRGGVDRRRRRGRGARGARRAGQDGRLRRPRPRRRCGRATPASGSATSSTSASAARTWGRSWPTRPCGITATAA